MSLVSRHICRSQILLGASHLSIKAAPRSLRIAAVQCGAVAGRAVENLNYVVPLVESAVLQGAELILLPEAFPQGYSYETSRVWPHVEYIEADSRPSPVNAPTCHALAFLAKRCGVWIGCTVFERSASMNDVFNTFVLFQPDGHMHSARHSKHAPAAFENLVFRAPDRARLQQPRVLDTPLGRLGVSICFETYLEPTWRELADQSPDVILLPHCGGVGRPSWYLPRAIVASAEASMLGAPAAFARALGVPTVFTNHVGSIATKLPGPFKPMSFLVADIPFVGGATVCAGGTGEVLAAAKQTANPDVAIATVQLGDNGLYSASVGDVGKPPACPPRAGKESSDKVARELAHLALPKFLTRAFAFDAAVSAWWYRERQQERQTIFSAMPKS